LRLGAKAWHKFLRIAVWPVTRGWCSLCPIPAPAPSVI